MAELQKMKGFRAPTDEEALNIAQCNNTSYMLVRVLTVSLLLCEILIGLALVVIIGFVIKSRRFTVELLLIAIILALSILILNNLYDRFYKYEIFLEEIREHNFEIAECKIDYITSDWTCGTKASIKIGDERCANLFNIERGLVKEWMRNSNADFYVIRCHYWTDEENVHTYICSAKDLQ